MKAVLAFDSFKGSISSVQACRAAAEALNEACPGCETILLPLSDGGEGFVSCIRDILPTETATLRVHGPLMNEIDASYEISIDGKTAYMEMAAASGLTLVPAEQRNPVLASTRGVGEMIVDAARRGCTEIVLGLGGSATCDAGRGMLDAIEASGIGILPHITAACDVSNPLFGPDGAACVFAPQKGATPEQVRLLDDRLRQFAEDAVACGAAAPEDACIPGAGAAGGLGYALKVFLHADLQPGIELMMALSGFDSAIAGADLAITGEGRSDAQTLMGKVPQGVLQHCRAQGIPVWLLSGSVDDPDGRLSAAFDFVSGINIGDPRPQEAFLLPSVAAANLRTTLRQAIFGATGTPKGYQ